MLNLDTFSPEMLRGVLVTPTVLYIQTLHNNFSRTEDVHLLFCAHLLSYSILGVLNIDIITSTSPFGC